MKHFVLVMAIAFGAAVMTSQADAQCYGRYGGYGGGYVVAAPVVVVPAYRPAYSRYGYAYRPSYGAYSAYRPYYGGYGHGYGYGHQHGYYGRGYGYGRGGVAIRFGY